MEISLVKTPLGLKPCDDVDLKKVNKIPNGEIVVLEYKQPRNYIFHKKLFALLDLMYENEDLTLTKDEYRNEVLIAAGQFNSYLGFNGEVVRKPYSLKFAKMDETEFQDVYNLVLEVAGHRLGLEAGTITEELKERLGNFH